MRKRFVTLVALLTMLALVLSACSKPESNQSGTGGSGAQKESVYHGAWAYDVPPKSHFNVFSTGNLTFPGGPYANLMTSPLALYYWHDNSWEKQLATDWTVENDTVTVSLRKGVKWSDGTEFTADDVAAYMWIGKAKNYALWRYVDQFKIVDSHKVEFHLSNNNPIALYYLLRMTPQPNSVYGEWAKKFEAQYAVGKDNQSSEIKALLAEFDAFRPAEYVASGPFKMDVKNITEAQVSLLKRADAWNADQVFIDKIVVYNGETAQATPLVLDKKIDYVSHAFPPATEAQFTNMGLRIIRFPYYTGPALFFNHTMEPFNKVEFRQAMAYLINRSEAGTVALGKSGIAVQKMAGIADNMVNTWMNPADAAKLNPYNQDLKKAEELLNSIGWKKGTDGQWVDASGKKVEFELSVPSDFADWSAAADNVAQQLTKFGIKTAIRGTVWSQYTTDMYDGKFQMGFLPWGSSTPHPQFAFLANYVNYNGGGRTGDKEKPGMNYALKQSYKGTAIDIDSMITNSAVGTMAEQKNVVGELALHFNEQLPIVPIFERYANAPILEGIHVTGWPAENDPLLTNGSADSFVTPLIVTGRLKGVTK